MIGAIIMLVFLFAIVGFVVLLCIGETRRTIEDMKPSRHEVSDAEFFGQIARDEAEMDLKPWHEGGWRE